MKFNFHAITSLKSLHSALYQVNVNMDEELQWRIMAFFNYWRQRHVFICDLDFREHSHEANVLLWAALDALSNLWMKNIGKVECSQYGGEKTQKRLIFDAFLAYYGGELFQIVSLPDVWNRLEDEAGRGKLPKDIREIRPFLSEIGKRRTLTLEDEYQVRQSSDDWSISKIIASILTDYPETNCAELKKWLMWSRYGAIAYKEMRSAYIHEGRSGEGTHGFELYGSAIRPTYLSGIYTTPPEIGFKVEFMVRVLGDCINKFEADALTLQQDPVPEE